MAVPTLHEITLPMLELLADGKDHKLSDLRDMLAKRFELSEEEIQELIPSGDPKFQNRVGWARSELKMSGLVEFPQPKVLKITPRGLDVLNKNPQKLNRAFLLQFPEYSERVHPRSPADAPSTSASVEKGGDEKVAPEEAMDAASRLIRSKLKSELIERVKGCSPAFFERLVVNLLVAMGYGGTLDDAGQAIGKSGDGGIDGIIKEDRLGLDVIYLQAKRWENTVGRPQIQNFVGALHGKGSKGVFITTSSYSKDAVEYAHALGNLKIILIDGDKLAELMIEHNIGVSPKQLYEIKKVDYDYFSEEE